MEDMPGKSVTLVTSKELMPSPTVAFPEKFRTRLRKKLEQVKRNNKAQAYFDVVCTCFEVRTHQQICSFSLANGCFLLRVSWLLLRFIRSPDTRACTRYPGGGVGGGAD